MENWLPVVGYEGLYEVSDLGQVRRLPNTYRSPHGGLRKPQRAGMGYLAVVLSDENKVKTPHYIHRLMMAAFVGPCPEGHNVNHKDGVRDQNSLGNLEYVTFSANTRHAYAHGLMHLRHNKGEDNHRSKITNEQARQVKILQAAGGMSGNEIAAATGVPRNTIYQIKRGVVWGHIAI